MPSPRDQGRGPDGVAGAADGRKRSRDASRHLARLEEALWLSEHACTLGFGIGVQACTIGFWIGRKCLVGAAAVRVAESGPRAAAALAMAAIGAVCGLLAWLGLLWLREIGTVAGAVADSLGWGGWVGAGSAACLCIAWLVSLAPPRYYAAAVIFVDEVLWVASTATLTALRFSRWATRTGLRAAREAARLSRFTSPGATVRALVPVVAPCTAGGGEGHAGLSNITAMVRGFLSDTAETLGAAELGSAMAVLSALQERASPSPPPGRRAAGLADCAEGDNVRRYVRFALGTHGHAGLKFLGAVQYGAAATDDAAAAVCAGIEPADIVLSDWRGRLFQPGHMLCVDRANRAVVVALRGSLWPQDWVTDFVCEAAPCPGLGGGEGAAAHAGMLRAAERLSAALLPVTADLLRSEQCAGYKVVLCGHSLGAGVAALMAAMWSSSTSRLPVAAREGLRCYGYGMPAVTTAGLGRALQDRVTAVVLGSDVVPRFSICSSARLRDAAVRLVQQGAISETGELLRRDPPAEPSEPGGAEWARLRWAELTSPSCPPAPSAPPMVPPGRVLWIPYPAADGEGVVEVSSPAEVFADIPLSGRVFEPHLPNIYAAKVAAA